VAVLNDMKVPKWMVPIVRPLLCVVVIAGVAVVVVVVTALVSLLLGESSQFRSRLGTLAVFFAMALLAAVAYGLVRGAAARSLSWRAWLGWLAASAVFWLAVTFSAPRPTQTSSDIWALLTLIVGFGVAGALIEHFCFGKRTAV
jgi:uncharacterized membrane protein